MAERRLILKALKILEAAYPHRDNQEATIAMYVHYLSDLPPDALARAITQHIRTSKYFPSVAELRQLVAEECVDLPEPEVALQQVRKIIARKGHAEGWRELPDNAVGRAALAHWWPLCYSQYPESVHREYMATYKRMRDQDIAQVQLHGLLSQDTAHATLNAPQF